MSADSVTNARVAEHRGSWISAKHVQHHDVIYFSRTDGVTICGCNRSQFGDVDGWLGGEASGAGLVARVFHHGIPAMRSWSTTMTSTDASDVSYVFEISTQVARLQHSSHDRGDA